MNHNTDQHREHTERCNSGILFLAGKQQLSSCTVGSHPLSKKCLFTENGDHYRNSQLDTIQRSTGHGDSSPNGCIYNTTPVTKEGSRNIVGEGMKRLRKPEDQEI